VIKFYQRNGLLQIKIQRLPKMNEKCVSCGVITDIHKNTDVNYRFYYVEGGGQLCKKCFDRVFSDENQEFNDYLD